MDFTLSEERRMLVETAQRFLRDRYDMPTRHKAAAAPDGFDRALWADMAELGLIGALVPPEAGGFGGAGEDVALVFEQVGRGLVVEPFLASGVLGLWPLVRAGETALVEQVMAGETIAAFAHGEPDGRYGLAEVSTRAAEGDGWRITGAKAVVLNGDAADVLIVSARVSGDADAEDGLGLFLVEAAGPGVTRRGYGTVDGARAAEIVFDEAPARPLGEPGRGFALIEETMGRGVLALAAEAVGLMEVCKDTTLDYLRTRKQFGRPLGAFQALQHRMVEMVLEIEQARSAVMLAAGTFEADRLTRERNLAAAKHLTGRVGRMVAEEAIQLHGGIAMTWEYPLPHYAKRLVMLDHLLGDTDHHLERFIRLGREDAA
ncbi:acyl-CoA dehydrogenase family protein [Limibaculum sp. M0105]|uniref:Acyl-CoA dehydrogenase family protein n=1 Tax=Thermohalobaculum xanthum TaxID=2753746 RepID=A0A8J7M9M4_9RHOB|nr:acyl-CoA dehydrogenase [Thermohalobaculum xanthum]MBK0400263.1 acyl-CoA dehydrogenase family protein [Thermohalobaculum xanthum]